MYLHNVYICDSMYGTVCISTRCATLCDLTHTQRPTGSLNPLSTEGPRGRGAGSYHWDPPSGDRWGQQPQAISASSDSVSLQVLVSPLRDFRSPAMLSLIDRHAGKVRVFWRIAGTPSPPMPWHSLELCTHDALLPNQAGTLCQKSQSVSQRDALLLV